MFSLCNLYSVFTMFGRIESFFLSLFRSRVIKIKWKRVGILLINVVFLGDGKYFYKASHRLFEKNKSLETSYYTDSRFPRTFRVQRYSFYFGSFKLQFFVARAIHIQNSFCLHFFVFSIWQFFPKGDLKLCVFKTPLFRLIFLCMCKALPQEKRCQIDNLNTNIKL